MKTEEFLDNMRDSWYEYTKNADAYNEWGLINLVAYMGERTGYLLQIIDQQQETIERLEQEAQHAV